MKILIWTGGHTIAESILLNPPEGVEVVSNARRLIQKNPLEVGERLFLVPRNAQTIADQIAYRLGIPRFLPSLSRVDLIHTVSGLIPTVPRPWITTISMPSSFYGLNDDWHYSRRRKGTLRTILRSENCRKVTCFSNSTLTGLKWALGDHLDKKISAKLEVMYPAVDSRLFINRKQTSGEAFRILFVGNHFFDKGGRELYRAVAELAPMYDVRLDLVTSAPSHHMAALLEFMRHHKEPWCNWHVPRVSRRQLVEEFFPRADVFVMCSYIDAFGFVLIEALASGLPLIAANVYAQREIVEHGINGYLIDTPFSAFEGNPSMRTAKSVERYRNVILSESSFRPVVADLRDRLRELIENDRLRREMAKRSLDMATRGRFSIGVRNQQLKRIYDEAIT